MDRRMRPAEPAMAKRTDGVGKGWLVDWVFVGRRWGFSVGGEGGTDSTTHSRLSLLGLGFGPGGLCAAASARPRRRDRGRGL